MSPSSIHLLNIGFSVSPFSHIQRETSDPFSFYVFLHKNQVEAERAMEEVEVMMMKFGDDKSALLDQYERLAVEIQLNQAMLKRSLSEPTHQTRSQAAVPVLIKQGLQAPPPQQPPPLVGKKRGRGSGFHKVLKKMIKPILLGRMGGGKKKKVPDVEVDDPRLFWKTFSRSRRF